MNDNPVFFRVMHGKLSVYTNEIEISLFDDPEDIKNDHAYMRFYILADIFTAKMLVKDTIAHFEENKNVGIEDVEQYLSSQIKQLKQEPPRPYYDEEGSWDDGGPEYSEEFQLGQSREAPGQPEETKRTETAQAEPGQIKHEQDQENYNPEKMLDLRKSLGEQSEFVKKAIEPLLTLDFAYTRECMDAGQYFGDERYKQFLKTEIEKDPNFIKEHILTNFSTGDLEDFLSGYGTDDESVALKLKSMGIEGKIYNNDIVTIFDDAYMRELYEKDWKDKVEQQSLKRQLKSVQKAGYVQGVCECVGIVSNYDQSMGKKLLSEMRVTKETAKKYASPETYKALEQGIFAPENRQALEQTQGVKR